MCPQFLQNHTSSVSLLKTRSCSIFENSFLYLASCSFSIFAIPLNDAATFGNPSLSAISANLGYKSVHSSFSPSADASKFSDVVNNMNLYQTWWGEHENILPIVHHVVNAINIFELEEFVKFMTNDFPTWRVEWDWIRWPQWQELSALPTDIKKELNYKPKLSTFEHEEYNFRSDNTINDFYKSTDRINKKYNENDNIILLTHKYNNTLPVYCLNLNFDIEFNANSK